MRTDRVDEFLRLAEQEGTKTEREKLLSAMSNSEIDYLIEQAGSQTAKIYYSSFKRSTRERG